MSKTADAILIGSFGAFLQELLFWYNARTKLEAREYTDILKSFGYYLCAVLMILASGVGTWLWFDPDPERARTYMLMGAAFPVLFKKLVDSFVSKNMKLGNGNDNSDALAPQRPSIKRLFKSYFSVS